MQTDYLNTLSKLRQLAIPFFRGKPISLHLILKHYAQNFICSEVEMHTARYKDKS